MTKKYKAQKFLTNLIDSLRQNWLLNIVFIKLKIIICISHILIDILIVKFQIKEGSCREKVRWEMKSQVIIQEIQVH